MLKKLILIKRSRNKSKKLVKVTNSCIKHYGRKFDEQMNSLIPMVVEQTSKGEKKAMIYIPDFLKEKLSF